MREKLINEITRVTIDETTEYFKETGSFLLELLKLKSKIDSTYFKEQSFKVLQNINHKLYQDEVNNYETTALNPDYVIKSLDASWANIFSYMYAQIRECIICVYENEDKQLELVAEFYLKLHTLYEIKGTSFGAVLEAIRTYEILKHQLITELNFIKQYDPSYTHYRDIVLKSDLEDSRYLFKYGKYISQSEIDTANYISTLSDKALDHMADAFVKPFMDSFKRYSKSMDGFETIILIYPIGFEKVIKKCVKKYEEKGLHVCLTDILFSKKTTRQLKYDHRLDDSLYLNDVFVETIIAQQEKLSEKYKDLIQVGAGYGMKCTFGEVPFSPVNREHKLTYTEDQLKAKAHLTQRLFEIKYSYISREKTSYTAIAYPVSEIGKHYQAIFNEMIHINTLDNELYAQIHQKIINIIDQGESVHILGEGMNETDLHVQMQPLKDINKSTNFFNCVATVNVPVGEVFTSPKLKGTTGLLHVHQVYLVGLLYKNLKIEFKDGMITAFTCNNFSTEAENKAYIQENLLGPHKTLPMGEFAIGTNTRAYKMAKKYNVSNLLPVLIAEKMGPHFAIGDTCYRGKETQSVFNHDGREITAKGNGYDGYTYKHIDITIPYEEIEEIAVIFKNKNRIAIIKDGLFVIDDMEELNQYLR